MSKSKILTYIGIFSLFAMGVGLCLTTPHDQSSASRGLSSHVKADEKETYQDIFFVVY